MSKRAVIVGSMLFQREMQEVKEELKKRGWIAFAPGDESDGSQPVTAPEKSSRKIQFDVFKRYHDEIDAADVVLCYNAPKHGVDGYIGANALIELGFGAALKKRLYLMFQYPNVPYHREELMAMQLTVLHGNIDGIV
jgi:nucleoside 2-deoxyribosyltransferase